MNPKVKVTSQGVVEYMFWDGTPSSGKDIVEWLTDTNIPCRVRNLNDDVAELHIFINAEHIVLSPKHRWLQIINNTLVISETEDARAYIILPPL